MLIIFGRKKSDLFLQLGMLLMLSIHVKMRLWCWEDLGLGVPVVLQTLDVGEWLGSDFVGWGLIWAL